MKMITKVIDYFAVNDNEWAMVASIFSCLLSNFKIKICPHILNLIDQLN
jgi:hypothetical protein